MRKLYILLIITIVFITGCGKSNNKPEEVIVDNKPEENITIIENTFSYSAQLTDVTGGQASGLARADFSAGVYIIEVVFKNLPEAQDDNFYEGWVVRKEPLSVISTGKAVKKEGIYTNTYISEQDLIDHNFYILTIEPDDNNPAPAEHILEGILEKINN